MTSFASAMMAFTPPLTLHPQPATVSVARPALSATTGLHLRTPPPLAQMESLPPPDGGGGDPSTIINIAVVIITLNVFMRMFSTDDGEWEDDKSLDEPLVNDRGFGWLQADLRMPLPSWEELQAACHLVGQHKGKYMYLCAESGQDGYSGCAISRDFSDYFKHEVYVCEGGDAERYRVREGV